MEESKDVVELANLVDSVQEDNSMYYELTIEVPEKNFTETMYLKKEPRKCSKCDNKRVRGWNATGNYPVICSCVKSVFVKLKDFNEEAQTLL